MPFSIMDALKKVRSPQPELEAQLGPVTQSVMPMSPSGILAGLRNFIGSSTVSGTEAAASRVIPAMSEASYRIAPVTETLGEVNPDFTPVGGEGLYNVGQKVAGASHGVEDLAAQAYKKYISRMK